MFKWVIEKISNHILTTLLVVATPAVPIVFYSFRDEATALVTRSTPESVALTIGLLSVTCFLLLVWALSLLPSLNLKYLPKYQFYEHRTNGLYYCPPCRATKPLSPLKKEISGWRCPFCKTFYKDPDYKEPPKIPSTYWNRGRL